MASNAILSTVIDIDDLDSDDTARWDNIQDFLQMDTMESLEETPFSQIYRAMRRDSPKGWVAIKRGSIDRKVAMQPHDIGKEERILLGLSSINVIGIEGTFHDSVTSEIYFWMPYVPWHLANILDSSLLSPYVSPDDIKKISDEESFILLLKSLVYQVLAALAYIHGCGIAHRDVKPRNILVTEEGLVQLIDFGIAWSPQLDKRDLWPEPPGRMCFDVATGGYRAPELLFGPKTYDAYATDLWSMGAVFAEFFTPFHPYELEEEFIGGSAEDEDEGEQHGARPPFIVPKNFSKQPCIKWERTPLYDSSRGQIGLAWSIFKIHGTPTSETWPDFNRLPDAQKVKFFEVPPVNLPSVLPNLPMAGTQPERDDCLDLLSRLLVYPPGSRMCAKDAVAHALFTRGLPLLLPPGYAARGGTLVTEYQERSLSHILARTMKVI